jgi:4-hydroxy-4-methyl-2-oxoglutarate aldolase
MSEGRIARRIQRADPEVLAGLAAAGVATVHEAGSAVLLSPDITPIQQGARVAGSAVTVSCPSGDNLMLHAAVETIEPGDILVVATTAPSDNGMFGELLAVSVMARGCRGLVIDAGVRDVAELRSIRFPVWTRTIHAQGTTKTGVGSVNFPVRCGGAEINPGDVLVADDDGVAVVERHRASEVLDAARARLDREDETRRRLSAGELSVDLYGFRRRLDDLGVRWVDDAEG